MAPSAITATESNQLLNFELAGSKPTSIALAECHPKHENHAAIQEVGETLRKRIDSVHHDHCGPGDEDAFFVADMGEIYRQHLRWKMNLKRVKPFYGRGP